MPILPESGKAKRSNEKAQNASPAQLKSLALVLRQGSTYSSLGAAAATSRRLLQARSAGEKGCRSARKKLVPVRNAAQASPTHKEAVCSELVDVGLQFSVLHRENH